MTIDYLFSDDWVASVINTESSWVSDVLENENGFGDIYLKCISKWFAELPGSNKQKNHLRASLKSTNNSDHLGAVNELSWWTFWASREFKIEPIPTSRSSTPDFILKFQKLCVIFEVTTLNPSNDERCREINYSQRKSLKRIIAKMYKEKIGQFQYGYTMKIPSALVLFNYDEWTGFGTQFHRLMDDSNLFSDELLELSAMIYVERFVIDGKPKLKKDSIVIIDNPNAKYPFPEKVKKILISATGTDNWIDCDNA